MPGKIISGKNGGGGSGARQGHLVGRILQVTGAIYLVGTILDLGILWLGQRQAGMQWEFVAITNTAEAIPRLVFGIALILLGQYIGRSDAVWVTRLMAFFLLLLGLLGLGLGVLSALNYFSIAGGLEPGSATLLRTATFKTVMLSLLYLVLLVPVGVKGLGSINAKRSGH